MAVSAAGHHDWRVCRSAKGCGLLFLFGSVYFFLHLKAHILCRGGLNAFGLFRPKVLPYRAPSVTKSPMSIL